ncbi:MAG: ABC transporter permease, partial [Clostridiales bacterium]|nr:ABC transporter permease [Clostridiales bacterium]
MIDLIRYECRKILGKKIVLIGLVLLAFFNVMLYKSNSLPTMCVLPDENGGYVKGIAAVTLDKAITQKYTGTLTDEKVQEMLRDFM